MTGTDCIREIRPKVLFSQIERRFRGENVPFNALIPPSSIGSLTLLEGAILVAMVRLLGARKIFEFGTYLGATSVLFAANSPEQSRITTLDLPPNSLVANNEIAPSEYLTSDTANDDFLRQTQTALGSYYINRASNEVRNKIDRLFLDSRDLDEFSDDHRQMYDLVFVDGGHDYETVRSDSQKSFQMVSPNGIVVWHDYASTIHGDVTKFVDSVASQRRVYRVTNSMIAFTLFGESASLIPQ